MNCKRNHENIDPFDEDVDQITQSRKIKKCRKDEAIGFCDCCEKLTSVKPDTDHPQFNYCIDCEVLELAFITEFLDVKANEKPIIEEIDEEAPPSPSNKSKQKSTCWGCQSPFQPNQLAHMEPGGCLYKDE